MMKITIANLYPDLLNLYGDRGNVAALYHRMKIRGIDVEIRDYAPGEQIDFDSTDIIYLGGGSDKEQEIVSYELCNQKEAFATYVEDGGAVLAVCSGFELLCKSYQTAGEEHYALGILDIVCEHSNTRFIGDVILQSELLDSTIVGFENHNSCINIGSYSPLGKVVYGNGNDGQGKCEGVVYKNLVGTFLHGPLLPKNPLLTDYLISKSLGKRFGKSDLEPCDDSLEMQAHNYILNKFGKK